MCVCMCVFVYIRLCIHAYETGEHPCLLQCLSLNLGLTVRPDRQPLILAVSVSKHWDYSLFF